MTVLFSESNGSGGGTDTGSNDQPLEESVDDADGAGCATTESSPSETTDGDKIFTLCLLHGGMDTEGEVFDDVLVFNLET
ncbi:hypothetical protein DPMN_165440 [Dreissena polymorpha]|uniref:Uncharacterized protein n=1 Tax=Dreissena polymorpha TaxID=45954 RepID=A0A9D4EX69_DREPO|nr:hypothetical protein DPMN_165440 [Dreissena polymorpha]